MTLFPKRYDVLRRLMKRRLVAIGPLFLVGLILTTIFATAQDRAPLPTDLTLAAALRIALINSTILHTAQANLDQMSGRRQQSKSPLLPDVNISAKQAYYTASLLGVGLDIPNLPTKIGPSAAMDARIGMTLDLLNVANLRDYKSSKSREDSSRFLVNDARELVTLTVVSAYLDALRAKASRDSLVEQTKLAQDLYQLTRDRVNQGVSAELDANRAMQQVNSLEQQRLEFEQRYVDAKLNLASILQARVTSEFEVSDPAAYGDMIMPVADKNAAVQSALTLRNDYRSATANVKAAELKIDSVNAERYPSLKIVADDGQSGSTPVHNINTYRVAGMLQIPIFTGGRIEGQKVEAEGALREARAAVDETRSQVERDVLTAINGVEWALKQVETSNGNITLSRQEVDLTRSRFTQGISDNTELVNAQTRLSQAEDARIRARYTLGIARANLTRATGVAENSYPK